MATQGGAVGVSSFPSPFTGNSRSSSTFCLKSDCRRRLFFLNGGQNMVIKPATSRRIACSAVQESSTSTVATDKKGVKKVEEEKEAPAAKRKPAKEPVKPLPQLMEEDVIPSLKAILESKQDITQLELCFEDNRLEGSFKKEDIPYSFWAFFPSGDLTGPKGFSISSYGSEASNVEPFLIDEKKITAKLIIFWVEKRLAAQGIIPVWGK